MAEPTIQLGGGKWAGKTDNLLGYYKEGKRFYKQDFTFSRSTTGTYVDSDGFIQEMPYNLLQQSNDFDTTWTTTNASVTGGQSGYDGSNDAWLLNESAVGGRVLQSISGSGVMTMSLYAKSRTLDFILVYINTTGTDPFAYFDLTNGDVGTSGASSRISASAVAVGDGWYRLSVTGNVGTLSSIEIYPANSLSSHTASAGSIYIQNSQLVKGTSAKTYFPTTTRLNMPRVDYLNNSNGSLILEPQRTNNFPNSSDFTIFTVASAGTGTNPTITSNYSISPDGNQNADRIIFDRGTGTTAGDTSYITYSLSLGTIDSTLSIYLKTNDGTTKDVTLRLGAALFDYDVTVTSQWQRFTLNGNTNVDRVQILLYGNQNSQTADLSCYGLQIEQGSYPTTLINTSGSSVTRNADSCSITNVADRIGQTEGTIYWEGVVNGSDNNFANLVTSERNTTTAFSILYRKSGSQFQCAVFDGTTKGQCIGGSVVFGQKHKLAYAYKSGDFVLYVDGVQVATSTQTWTPSATIDDLYLGDPTTFFGYKEGNRHDNTMLFKTRLTNTELATLTTL